MIKHIEAIICSFSGENISPEILHSNTQKEIPKTARQIIWYFAKKETKQSLEILGSYFNKDHATVLSAIKRINNLIDTEPLFAKKIKEYQNRIILHKEIISRIDISTLLLHELKINIEECSNKLVSLNTEYNKLKNDINFINNLNHE